MHLKTPPRYAYLLILVIPHNIIPIYLFYNRYLFKLKKLSKWYIFNGEFLMVHLEFMSKIKLAMVVH